MQVSAAIDALTLDPKIRRRGGTLEIPWVTGRQHRLEVRLTRNSNAPPIMVLG